MRNLRENTILSSFDSKITLMQKLKDLKKTVDEYIGDVAEYKEATDESLADTAIAINNLANSVNALSAKIDAYKAKTYQHSIYGYFTTGGAEYDIHFTIYTTDKDPYTPTQITEMMEECVENVCVSIYVGGSEIWKATGVLWLNEILYFLDDHMEWHDIDPVNFYYEEDVVVEIPIGE